MILDRTLPAVWVLHGSDVPALAHVLARAGVVVVDDVEVLCASIVVEGSRSDAPYVPSERADLYEALGFLLGRTVEVLPRYDPDRGRRVYDPWTQGFRAWLHDELAMDLIDQWRSWFGRSGHKRLAIPRGVHFAEETDGAQRGFAEDNDGRSQSERRFRGAADEAAGDRGDSGLDALRRRFLEGGDRALLREVEALGLGATAGARDGAARPDSPGPVDLELVSAA